MQALLYYLHSFNFSIKSSAVTVSYSYNISGYAISDYAISCSSISDSSSSQSFSFSVESLEYFSLKILMKVEDTSSVPKNVYTHVVNVGDNST